MAKFALPPVPSRDNQKDGPRPVENIHSVSLKIEEIADGGRTATGVDIASGEVMTISLATVDEWARVGVNPRQFTNQEDRDAKAKKDLRKQPSLSDVKPGNIMNFQQVKKLNREGGRMIAKWTNALLNDPEREAAFSAQVKVEIKNADNPASERREITAFMMNDTQAANPQSVGAALSRMTAEAGDEPMADARLARPLLVTIVANDEASTPQVATVFPTWDGEAKDHKQGVDSIFERGQNRWAIGPMAALAAKLELPLDVVKPWVDDRASTAVRPDEVEDFKAQAEAIYEAAQKGQIAVLVTPGVQATTMPFLKDKLIAGEREDSFQPNLSDRHYFSADVSLQARPGDGNYPASWQVKELQPSEFLSNKGHDNYRTRNLPDLGDMAVAVAEANHELRFEPVANAPAAETRVEAEQEQKAERGSYVPSGAGMDM